MISQSAFASVIASIYEAGVDFERWPDALGRVAEAVGGHSASLVRQGLTVSDFWGAAVGVEDGYSELYLAHFHGVNPLWRRTWTAPAGSVHADSMVMARPELARTEFFQDFLAPQGIGGMVNAVVLMEEGRQSILTVHAPRQIETEAFELFKLLTPHLQRAAELNVQLARADLKRAGAEVVMDRLDRGVLLVDADCRLIFANRLGEALLSDGGALRLAGGVVQGGSMADTAALQSAIAACLEPGPTTASSVLASLSRSGGRPPLTVQAAPAIGVFQTWASGYQPVAILCVTDPERIAAPAIDELRKRFGLTRAQAAFASEIVQGDGIQAAADRLSITRATARSHLAQIFEKTGVQRQSELVRLLLSSGLSMRPS